MDSIELHRLSSERHGNTAEYKRAMESYNKIYNNIMSKGKDKQEPKFLGGNPVTLEKNDFSTLVQKDYMVSAKADGLRFLLMIGDQGIYGRNIYFVDKNLDFWILQYKGEMLMSITDIAPILLDGELIMWGKIINRTPDLIKLSKASVLYSSFDILYGPSTPEFEGEGSQMRLVLGASFAMMGPKGGKRWPWYKRYNILNTLVKNQYSPLYRYNKHLQSMKYEFNIVVSPFVHLKDVLLGHSTATKMYNYMIKLFQKSLKEQYPGIKKVPRNISGYAKGQGTDGLILTPYNTEYIRGPWSFCGNSVFKWKPEKELTVDVQVGEDGVALAYRDLELVPVGNISNLPTNVQGIVECNWKKDKYVYRNSRPDKIKPNHYSTVMSVINAIKDPIDLSVLRLVYLHGLSTIMEKVRGKKLNKLSKPLQKIITQLGSEFHTRCYLSKTNNLFNDTISAEIMKMIESARGVRKLELESRINFPYRTKPYFGCILNKVEPFRQELTPNLKIYGRNGKRISYAILGNYKILEEAIVKRQLGDRLQLQETELMNAAGYRINRMDFVLSEEIPTDDTRINGSYYRYQTKYSLNNTAIWRLDLTEYGESRNSAKEAKQDYERSPKTSVEIEYAPGDAEEKAWSYYKVYPTQENLMIIINHFKLETEPTPEAVRTALDERINKLHIVPVDIVYKDYCRLLLWLFRIVYT